MTYCLIYFFLKEILGIDISQNLQIISIIIILYYNTTCHHNMYILASTHNYYSMHCPISHFITLELTMRVNALLSSVKQST